MNLINKSITGTGTIGFRYRYCINYHKKGNTNEWLDENHKPGKPLIRA